MRKAFWRLAACVVATMLLVAQRAAAQFGTVTDAGIPYTVTAYFSPNVAFPGETVRLDVVVDLKEGWHLYAFDALAKGPIPTSLTLKETNLLAEIENEAWKEPPPKEKFDAGFRAQVAYHEGRVVFSRNYRVNELPVAEHEVAGSVRVQVCDANSCLPPRRAPFVAKLLTRQKDAATTGTVVAATPAPTPEATPQATPAATPATTSEAALEPPREVKRWSSETEQVSGESVLGLMGKAFLLGMLSLLTPCVFPMIPLTISFFTKRAAKTTAGRVALCSVYSGSIVLGFALFGFVLALVVKMLGGGVERAGAINNLATNPWFNLVLAGVFVAFGLSLLGLFEIGLPSSWANKLDKMRGKRADAWGAVLMAMVFVIVSFTCTAPIVGPLIVLTFQGFWLQPFIGLTAYACGFALPFFLLGLVPSAIQSLPKSGDWLHATKVTLGLVEIAAALKFVSNSDLVWQWQLVTRELLLAAWTAIALATTLYLMGAIRFIGEEEKARVGPVRMGFGLLFGTLCFYLAYGLFGGHLNSNLESYLPPRQGQAAVASANSSGTHDPDVIMNDLAAAQAKARELGKPLFIDFTGWTCTNCRLNELKVFPDPEVQKLFGSYVRVALYTDDKDFGEKYENYQLQRFGTAALPFYVVLSPSDDVIATYGGLIRDKAEFVQFLGMGVNQKNAP